MKNYLTFAGVSSNDFGVWISGEGTYNRPRRKYEEKAVPGRDGTLLIDTGRYENQVIEYPACIMTDMPNRIDAFINAMAENTGYQRLEDTYHPYEYRVAQFVTETKVKTSGYRNREGQFDLAFNCMPQRFLKSGEKFIQIATSGDKIINRTNMKAKPYLRIYGTGAGTVGIGSETITINAISQYVDIDCDIMDAFKGSVNCNANVSFTGAVTIPPGEHGITFTGLITSVEVKPRWYII